VTRHFSLKLPNFKLQPALAWLVILGFLLLVLMCVGIRLGRVLNFVFPVGSFGVGTFLYFRYPLFYNSFTWWIWFLTPWMRRVIDLQAGYTEPSIVLTAPLLVTSLTFLTFIKHLPKETSKVGLAFILCAIAVIYSFLVGMINNSPVSVILNFLGWITPLLFGFHLYVNWRSYPEYRQNTQRTFFWGTMVMGIYGVVQFLIAPEWDRYWLTNVQANGIFTFGNPEPLGIRVYSTMNAPQPFAAVMMAGLLLLFCGKQSALLLPAAAGGFLSFLLSLARSAWLSWLAGMVIFFPALKPQLQMRLIIGILIASLAVVPLVMLEPFGSVIGSRFESLSSNQQDESYQDRAAGYTELVDLALTKVIGGGMGYEIESTSIGSRDSGILSMLFSLGWFGTIPYLFGLLFLFFSLFQTSQIQLDPFATASIAIAVGTLTQIGLNIATAGVIGLILWSFLGLGLAAKKYYINEQNSLN
jgi:hypothetical protein